VALSGNLALAAISVGQDHSCAIATSGATWCWGDNSSGELGNGTRTVSLTPTQVSGNLVFTSVSAGDYHTCALTADGSAYCWGFNISGQLGISSPDTARLTPQAVTGALRFASIAAGQSFTCGLTPAGAAYCWGDNTVGELGNGTTVNASAPTPAAPGLSLTALSVGGHRACGLTSSRGVVCWGGGGIAGAYSTLPVAVPGGLTFASISVSDSHTCGLATDGIAYCWGGNYWGELGDGTTAYRGAPVQVEGQR
jgi:alpha-tubulin suppressor-like RCC1 family protein